MNIRLGIGLEDVLFGQSVEEVERSLGPAPECSFEKDEDDSIRALAYPADGVHLFFHEGDGFRLGSIEVSLAAGVYGLFGTPLRAVGKEDVIDFLGRNSHRPPRPSRPASSELRARRDHR